MFWKKKEDEITERDFPEGFEQSNDEETSNIPAWSRQPEEPRLEEYQERIQTQKNLQQPQMNGNSHEIIVAKLDVISAKLDGINQRLANIEQQREKPSVKW